MTKAMQILSNVQKCLHGLGSHLFLSFARHGAFLPSSPGSSGAEARGYLCCSGAVTGNLEFEMFMGDFQVFSGVNSQFPATAEVCGKFL